MENTKEKLIDLLAKQANVPAGSITPESTWQDLSLDSIEVIEAMMAVEDAFKIKIPDTDMPLIENVQQLVEYIEGYYEK